MGFFSKGDREEPELRLRRQQLAKRNLERVLT